MKKCFHDIFYNIRLISLSAIICSRILIRELSESGSNSRNDLLDIGNSTIMELQEVQYQDLQPGDGRLACQSKKEHVT